MLRLLVTTRGNFVNSTFFSGVITSIHCSHEGYSTTHPGYMHAAGVLAVVIQAEGCCQRACYEPPAPPHTVCCLSLPSRWLRCTLYATWLRGPSLVKGSMMRHRLQQDTPLASHQPPIRQCIHASAIDTWPRLSHSVFVLVLLLHVESIMLPAAGAPSGCLQGCCWGHAWRAAVILLR